MDVLSIEQVTMTPLVELFDFIFKPLLGGVVAIGVWMFKRQSAHAERINTLEEKSVTEVRVRDIIREEIAPMATNISELKNLVQSQNALQTHMMAELAEERGFRRGQAEANKS